MDCGAVEQGTAAQEEHYLQDHNSDSFLAEHKLLGNTENVTKDG